MITTPASDVVLDEVQARKIEVAGHKLSVIETEVVIANRNLRVLKDDIVKATLEHKELEEKIANADSLLSEKNAENKRISSEVAEATKLLEAARKDALEFVGQEAIKNKELEDREEAVSSREKEVEALAQKLLDDSASLLKSREEAESVKKAFDAITLPWQ